MSNSNSLTPVRHGGQVNSSLPSYMQGDEDLARKALNEAKQASDIQLSRIKIAAGGANLFIKGDESYKELYGTILGVVRAFAFWIPKDQHGNPLQEFYQLFPESAEFRPEPSDVPLCHAFNDRRGSHPQMQTKSGLVVFGNCDACYFNTYKSDIKGGAGKGCKNGRRLLFLMKDAQLPSIVTLPPTSIRPFDEYITYLNERSLPFLMVYTRITLEEKRNAMGQPYSVCRFDKPAEPLYLSKADYEKMKMYKLEFEKIMSQDIQRDEFEGDHANGNVSIEAPPIDTKIKRPATKDQTYTINKLLNSKNFSRCMEFRAEVLNFTNDPDDWIRASEYIAVMMALPDAKKKQ